MACNLRLIDDCTKILKRTLHIVDDSEEAKVLSMTMSELEGDINYIQKELGVVGKSIDKLQNEVSHVIFRRLAELTKRQRSNLKIPCKAAIPLCLPF